MAISMQQKMQTETDIWQALEEVMDPEIPTISVVDLGIVTSVKVDGESASVVLTPTFAGCPALKVMEQLVTEKLHELGFKNTDVKHSFETTWTTNLITEKGRLALLKHGLAPPPQKNGYFELDVLSETPCPYCGSKNTTMQTPFGPTLCRSMHYCKNCLNAFEAFKPLV